MPSIRRSLIAYFLILLVAAFGGIGFWVYRFTTELMAERERADVQRIEQEYTFQCSEAKRSFDANLESRAANLGRELRTNYAALSLIDYVNAQREDGEAREARENREREEYQHYQTIVSSAFGGTFAASTADLRDSPSTPQDYETVASSVFGGMFGPITAELRSRPMPLWRSARSAYRQQQMDEQVQRLLSLDSEGHPKYFQFNYPRPRQLRVLKKLGTNYQFPTFPMGAFGRDPNFTTRFDDIEIGGEPVRRVIYKASLAGRPTRWMFREPSLIVALSSVMGGSLYTQPQIWIDRNLDPLQYVWVQAAEPRQSLDETLAKLDETRKSDLEELSIKNREALASLRTQLMLIGLVTLIALPVGGWFLIGRGVAPLRKLSDAVSQVSEKDFRLPVMPEELSHELVPIHDRLTHTLDALRRAFEREKQATADISHELRTPIASLLTTVEVALRKQRTADQYRTTLEECREISMQLSRLVKRIMTLAWLDAGNDRISKTEVDATEVAGGCATVIRPLAESQGLSFTTDFDSSVPTYTDPDKLREVLLNLLHNAIEYNRPGGSVALAVNRNNGSVQFEVRDTGIGMTPEIKGRIFERFFRADPSRTATGVHAGLGLAIVKEYVDRLGATIAVESKPGVGTTFRVSLPAGSNGSGVSNQGSHDN